MARSQNRTDQLDYLPRSTGEKATLVWAIALSISAMAVPVNAQQQTAEAKTEIRVVESKATQESGEAQPKANQKQEPKSDPIAPKAPKALTEKGPMQEIAEPMDQLIDMAWQAGKLNLTTKTSYEQVDPIVDQIRQKVGWGGGSSSHGGSSGFSFDINSEKLNGQLKRAKEGNTMVTTIAMDEAVKPYRTLRISVSDSGELRVTINASQSAYLLRISQQADGQFMVQELSGTEVFAGVTADFDSFCRQHRDYTANRLLPALKHFGLGQVLTPYSPEIQKRVAELLSPWQEEEIGKIRALTVSLAADSYAEREAASQQLEESYQGNEELYARVVHDPQFHPETRARARNLIRAKVDEDKLDQMDFVDTVASSLDAPYLMDLIRIEQDPERRDQMVDRLRFLDPGMIQESTTNQEVISMVVNRAAEMRTGTSGGSGFEESQVNVLEETGHLQEIQQFTGQLVRLVWHENQLSVDREHWKAPFQGRDIAELSKEIEKLVEKNNLPKNWYNSGGPMYNIKASHHPQVIFEKLQQACGTQAGNNHHIYSGGQPAGTSTPNRQFDTVNLKGELTFDRSARNQRRGRESKSPGIDGKPFVLMLTEKTGPGRSLTIDEEKPGQMRIMVTGDAGNYIVQLIIEQDKAIIQDVRGSKVQAFQGKTFRDLQEKHAEYFSKSFFPLLRHAGVQVAPDIDAGPDGDETTRLKESPEDRKIVAGS